MEHSIAAVAVPPHVSVVQRMQAEVDARLAGCAAPRVLEAGCGSGSHLRLSAGAHVTGIDISEQQLARNALVDVKICGDLQRHDFGDHRFDLIVCWDVLEHLDRPDQALQRLFAALAPGGLVVLALPNLYSLKGAVTKFTPYGFHVWFYRRVMKDTSSREEFRQFPTFLRREIGAGRLCAAATRAGLNVVLCERYEGPVQAALRNRNRLADTCFAVAGAIGRTFTAGRLDPNWSDMVLVLQRPAA